VQRLSEHAGERRSFTVVDNKASELVRSNQDTRQRPGANKLLLIYKKYQCCLELFHSCAPASSQCCSVLLLLWAVGFSSLNSIITLFIVLLIRMLLAETAHRWLIFYFTETSK
jgi:hypothetical protein